MLDFKNLRRPKTPNTYLLAPIGVCENAVPDAEPTVFYLKNAATLKADFLHIMQDQPRVSVLEDEGLGLELRQKTPLMGFPDFISVKFINLEEGKSTLAIYSRSKYGRKDFGVNRKRIELWVDLLRKNA
ncbi:DUF1499 domain-containing protein [Hirschia litorea]|uniref:DUF1499 domain-containing protein n=1 Tax=Hirschia litorea TaxID=1199156 RepID=A0ABW2IGA6_9PROT